MGPTLALPSVPPPNGKEETFFCRLGWRKLDMSGGKSKRCAGELS
jgi:hypothetical protein